MKNLGLACMILSLSTVGPLFAAGVIRGIVRDVAANKPASKVKVLIDEVKTSNPHPVHDSATTAADGSFRFPDLPAVTTIGYGFNLRIPDTNYAQEQMGLLNVAEAETTVTEIRVNKRVTLVVKAGQPGAHISLDRRDGYPPLTGLADAAGHARFGRQAPGVLGATVAARGYRTAFAALALDGVAWEESDSITLERDAANDQKAVTGKAAFANGGIHSGIEIRFACASALGRVSLFASTDSLGRYRIEGIPSECAQGTVYTKDSLQIMLPARENSLDLILPDPPILGLKTERRRGAGRWRPWEKAWRSRDAIGRARP